jgi:penicillin-binding protein 1A
MKKKARKAVKILWIFFLSCVLLFFGFVGLVAGGAFGSLPSLKELENPQTFLPAEVYAEDGTLMGKFYTERGNRSYVDYKDISTNVIYALIATEDKRFFDHSGIDVRSLGRAVFTLGKQGGASTITQQLAKGLLAQGSRKKVTRVIEKMKEWIVASRLEKNFTKEEIIASYLNNATFDDNIYGIRNAAKVYFQKDADRLSMEEAAVLVGMLKGNYIYNPRKNPKAAIDRRNTVLDLMVENSDVAALVGAKALSSADGAALKAKPIELRYKREVEAIGIAPYFRDELRKEMARKLKTLKTPDGGTYDIYRDGLKIYTTINPRMQIYAEEAVAEHLSQWQRIFNQNRSYFNIQWNKHKNILDSAIVHSERWKDMKEAGVPEADILKSFNVKTKMTVFAWNNKREKDTTMTPLDSIKYCRQLLQTAFMVMDPTSGEVKAWVGGIDYKNFKLDHVTRYRQVGSTIKPMLYCLNMEEGLEPNSIVENNPQRFPGFGVYPNAKSYGSTSFERALALSLNNVAAYLLKRVSIKRFKNFLQDNCGIKATLNAYPSICLGADEIPLIQLLRAYTMFPGRGVNTEPYFITKIEDRNGNLIQSFVPERKDVISERSAYQMCEVMEGPVTIGTAKGLKQSLGVKKMGGKTGTTNDNTDCWFVGYTPQLLAGAWVGCDDPFIRYPVGNAFLGGKAAAPIWKNFFKRVLNDKTTGIVKDTIFPKPQSMTEEVSIDFMRMVIDPVKEGVDGYDGSGGGGGVDFNSQYNDMGTEDNIGGESSQYSDDGGNKPVTEPLVGPMPDTGTGKKPATPPAKEPVKALPPDQKPKDDPKNKDKKKDDKNKPKNPPTPTKPDDYE